MPIRAIKVGPRHRKDLGDLQALADSIRQVGLLHPIVISSDGWLIAGQRRLAACRLLGWDVVRVNRIDLEHLILGEQHENLVRKDLLPSEIVALKRALEPLERQAARQRQGRRTDLHPARMAGSQKGETRDRLARCLGVGRTTIDKAEAVVAAAESDPENYGRLVEAMDKSGNVSAAFRRLGVERQARQLQSQPPPLPQGPFQIIVADPPWRYEGGNCLPYPTMAVEEIRALPVKNLACDDAILWLWTTNAHLPVAFSVAEAWGFEYKSLLTG